MYQASCPSHPSREAPPERGQYRYTILFIRCPGPSHLSREAPPERGQYRNAIPCIKSPALPTPPGRPRLSAAKIGIPYYLSTVVPIPPLQEGPA